MESRRAALSEGLAMPCYLAVLGLALASVARAEHPPTTRPSMQRMFADLADTDERVREAARLGLMRLTRDDLPALGAVVQKARPLRPAQAAALRGIVQEIYLSGEIYKREPGKGFLGVMMDDSATTVTPNWTENESPASAGVIVAERIPGFCAARWLIDGDVILGTMSPFRIFKSAMDLKQTIGPLGAGGTARLLVFRRGQVMEVTLRLDPMPAEMSDTTDTDQRTAFRARRQKKFEDYWNREFEPLFHETVG
jgi:hypothetical protein